MYGHHQTGYVPGFLRFLVVPWSLVMTDLFGFCQMRKIVQFCWFNLQVISSGVSVNVSVDVMISTLTDLWLVIQEKILEWKNVYNQVGMVYLYS